MGICKSDFLGNFIILHSCILQKFLRFLHAGTDQNLCKSLSRKILKDRTEIACTDIQIGTDTVQA